MPLRPSIHQHQHGGWLGGLHHVLELPVLRVRFLELGGDGGDGFQEVEEEAALDRVIHFLRKGPSLYAKS